MRDSDLPRRQFIKTLSAGASALVLPGWLGAETPEADAVAASVLTAAEPIRVTRLRCEWREDPLGIDARRPRLSWGLASTARGKRQTAYRILVASSPEKLEANQGDWWDSGRVAGDQPAVAYAGRPLSPNQRCYWKVRVWDETGQASAWSDPATWTMDLLNPEAWHGAQWIGAETGGKARRLPLFRKEFSLPKAIRQATLSIAGLGFYELYLNGAKVGDHVLDPGWTDYEETVLYVTHDVTDGLRQGGNALGVMLGNGMYNVPGGRYAKFTGSFGAPKLILHLHLEFSDGTTSNLVSDGTWRVHPGPITFSCIFGGEDYDARLEQAGWHAPGFDDASWTPAQEIEEPGGRLTAQDMPPLKMMGAFEPVDVTEPEPGVYVYDLGQNFSGWPELTVRGPAGAQLKLLPGEVLDEDGLVNQRSMGGSEEASIYFAYTLRGEGEEAWHPRFSYTGFRYVQVEGATPVSEKASAEWPVLLGLRGHFVHSSARTVGHFASSNTLFNDIHAFITGAIRSNMPSILTDCPHREKLGWLEEVHLMGPSVMYNYDVPALYAKIIRDMSEAQLKSGLVPDIAPEYVVFEEGFRDSPEWGSAYVIAPWLVYQRYGDARILRAHYEGMRRYVDYLTSRSEDHIVTHGLGDWHDIGPGRPGPSQLTSKGVTATAIYYADLTILTDVATLLEKTDDAETYARLAEDVRQAFNETFFDSASATYDRGSQTANAMPLALGMVPPGRVDDVLENIVEDVRAHGNHMTSGDIGHRFLLQVLLMGGRSDVVFDMTAQTEAPSYGNQLAQGATTLTETWDADPRWSQNHFMLGHVEEWLYQGLAGIRLDPEGPGFEKIIIKPEVVGDLTWVEATYDSVRGEIASRWEIEDDRFTLNVTIPPNTTATVYVPAADEERVREGGEPVAEARGVEFLRTETGRAVYRVESGAYRFTSML